MPDLSLEGCHRFWQDFPDPYVYKAIALLESSEDWTLDGDPDIENAISDLAEVIAGSESYTTSEQEAFITICSSLRMSRKLRLMQIIDQGEAGSASKLLSFAESNQNNSPNVSLFLRRNIIFERIRLVSRMLSPDRIEMMKKSLSNES